MCQYHFPCLVQQGVVQDTLRLEQETCHLFMDEEEMIELDLGGRGEVDIMCCVAVIIVSLEGTNLFFSKFLQNPGELFVVFIHAFVVFVHAFVVFPLVSSEIIKLRI